MSIFQLLEIDHTELVLDSFRSLFNNVNPLQISLRHLSNKIELKIWPGKQFNQKVEIRCDKDYMALMALCSVFVVDRSIAETIGDAVYGH